MLTTFRKKRKSNTRRNLLVGAGVGAVGLTGAGYLLTRSRPKRASTNSTAIVHVPGQGYTHGASAPMLEFKPKLQTRKGRPNKNWDKYARSNPGAYSKVNVNRSNLFSYPDRGMYFSGNRTAIGDIAFSSFSPIFFH